MTNMYNRKIRVHHEWDSDYILISPISYEGDTIYAEVPDKDGKWKRLEKKRGELFPDNFKDQCLKFTRDDAEKLYHGLMSIFGKQQLEPKQAELDATRYHLEDMRKLVFK